MAKEEIEQKYVEAGLALERAEQEVGKTYSLLKRAEREHDRLWSEYMEARHAFLKCLEEEKPHESAKR